ncbi:hypothetical protein SARC_00646 [Sphaeroforma arctica JP610]|uniref:VPS9 domain-containing protein n=1 Tax=Sphaeroforma arctica JP610 TaxID=667725 RepID=A0A0L0GDX1_9EUKA|nr:hypothetical protein SARC_00646 [Sphaeroforma arctica JP610]KNC87210.1 hypothetical protein SARC_00646 [Sphaeroforma arctica JP610]|eukprot:XP_014161112.1 hypothetical protein SARC_00646 [Sphaeroforma arctica JP610]
MPILIYVILVTNPMNFKSNLMYIERFRNPRMLVSEQAYYYTTMVSAVEFVSNLDEKTLNIDPDDFERQVDEGEAKWNMSLRPRNVSNTDANNKDAASAKSSSGSWRLGRRTLLSSLQSYVSEVPNILNRGSGSGTTRVDQPDSKEITTPEPKASASRSNTSPLPVNIASEAQNNGATTEQGLDRDAVIQYMKSLATNYSGTDPRLRVLNVEDLDFENVPLLLREYQRMAGLMDHMMELIHDMP